MQKERISSLTDKAAAKAMADSTFRAALVKNANEAIKNEFNEELPLKVTFHEFNDKKVVFVLPAKAKEGELSDDALDKVSGGTFVKSLEGVQFAEVMGYACFPDYLSPIQLEGSNTGGTFIK